MFDKIIRSDFYRNSFIFIGGSFVANGINYFFRLAVGRMVTVDNYGQIESLVSILSIFSVFSVVLVLFFTDLAAAHKAQKAPWESRKVLVYFAKKTLPLLTGIAVFFVLVTPWVVKFLNISKVSSIAVVWMAVLVIFLLSAFNGILKGWQQFKSLSLGGIWGALGKFFAGIILISLGWQVFGAIFSYAFGSIVSLLVAIVYLRNCLENPDIPVSGLGFRQKGKNFFGQTLSETIFGKKIPIPDVSSKNYTDFKITKEHTKKIGTYFSAALAIAIFANADMISARHNLDSFSAGGFGALSITSKIIYFICSSVVAVFFSYSLEQFHKKDQSNNIFFQGLGLTIAAGASLAVFYFIFPGFILGTLFGNKFLAFSGYLGYFAVFSVLLSLNNFLLFHLVSNNINYIAHGLLLVSLLFFVFLVLWGSDIKKIMLIIAFFQIVSIFGEFLIITRGTVLRKKNANS